MIMIKMMIIIKVIDNNDNFKKSKLKLDRVAVSERLDDVSVDP